jgi:GH24 family phage-related lysozyme (muramidase)
MEPSYLSDLIAWEQLVLWPYCDSGGNVTIGIGCMIPTAAAMAALTLHVGTSAELATDPDKMDAYDRVKASFRPTLAAWDYRDRTDLRLTVADAEKLCRGRLLSNFLPALRRIFPGFDGFPLPARRGLVDMIYNLGEGEAPSRERPEGDGLLSFVDMIRLCNAVPPDWAGVALQSHRRSARPSRNDWTRDMFLDAAVDAAGGPARAG